MEWNYRKAAGILLFIGSTQFILGMLTAEALYADYSVSLNYISDLGVGSTALIFNSSVFLLGIMVVAASFFIQRLFDFKLLSMFMFLTGIGAMGVGLFPENFGMLHTVSSLFAFLFGSLSAIASFKLQKAPLSYLAIILGFLSLFSLVLFGSGVYLGLGKGGMERMIAYPTLLWAVGFGGYLIGSSENS